MTDDLAERLSYLADDMYHYAPDARFDKSELVGEAKARIEALTTQIAEDADVRTQIDHRLEELVAQVDALTALVREADDLFRGDLTGLQWKRECREFRVKARAALTGNVTVGGGRVDWGASFLPAALTGKDDT
jgi:hypothetical protein